MLTCDDDEVAIHGISDEDDSIEEEAAVGSVEEVGAIGVGHSQSCWCPIGCGEPVGDLANAVVQQVWEVQVALVVCGQACREAMSQKI